MPRKQRKRSIAIIGAGPAGFFSAETLLKKFPNVQVDIIDRSPFPYGLVRTGVAPDHQKIKNVEKTFRKVLENENVRFFGGLRFGVDFTLEQLRQSYHQVIFATGASDDRLLKIPGEDHAMCLAAREFVEWYNDDLFAKPLDLNLFDTRRVGIIGIGNVAIDVARILCLDLATLRGTDISKRALSALSESRIEEIHFFIRRGPAQAACTPKELKELASVKGVQVRLNEDGERVCNESNPHQEEAKLAALFLELASTKVANARINVTFHFLRSPKEIVAGESSLTGLICTKNKLVEKDGASRAEPIQHEEELTELELLFRSIGYRSVALPGVPFDTSRALIPNEKGAVVNSKGERFPGLFVSGWAKRGPSGLIGTNKADAAETVEQMLAEEVGATELRDFSELLKQANIDWISTSDVLRLDAEELRRGELAKRVREKFTSLRKVREFLRSN